MTIIQILNVLKQVYINMKTKKQKETNKCDVEKAVVKKSNGVKAWKTVEVIRAIAIAIPTSIVLLIVLFVLFKELDIV